MTHYYVDANLATGNHTGADWTNAFASLFAAEAALQGVLSEPMTIHCRATAGTVDATEVAIAGWTTTAANYLLIQGESGSRAKASGYDTACYALELNNGNPLSIQEDYVRIDGIQLRISAAVAGLSVLAIDGITATNNYIRISNCRLTGPGAATSVNCLYVVDANAIVDVWNCILEGAGSNARGIRSAGATVNVYNSIVYEGAEGIYRSAGTLNVYNCAVLNTGDDFSGTVGITTCASDDADGDVAEDGGSGDWTGDFADGSAGDWTLLTGSGLKGTGTQQNALFTTDINGLTRGPTWDVGPDQFADTTSAGLPIPVAMHHYKTQRRVF